MAQNTSAIQLPPGYEDATPVAGPLASSGVTLPAGYEDAQPIKSPTTPEQPGVLSRSLEGAKQFAQPIAALVKPPETPTEALIHAVGGGGGALAAYRLAKNIVKSAEDVVTSTPERYQQAVEDFNRGVQDFHNKDFRNGLSDVVSTGADLSGLTGPGTRQIPDAVRELSEGVRPGGNLATPLVKNALNAGLVVGGEALLGPAGEEEPGASLSNTLKKNPFKTSKIEPTVAANTAKAGLEAGTPGLTTAEAVQKTAQAAQDAKIATQANADQALQDIANQHAQLHNLPAPAAGTAPRDLITMNGEALVDAGKADYQVLDKYTNGKFTNAQNELKNAQKELQQKAGTTDADTSTLEANVTRAQWNVDKLFDDAVADGMPRGLADAARAKFRAGQATLDAGNAVRMANKAVGAAGDRITNLNALENRWTALYDSGRLQQAFGEQGAKDALTAVKAARETGEIYQSLPPTESAALRQLIEKHTTTGKLGANTDWAAVQKDFSSLPDRNARFSDVPKVEKFINDQKFYQRLKKVAIGGAAGAAGTALAGEIYHAVQ